MAIAATPEDEGRIYVTSIVSGRTFEPLVEIKWGEKKCQLGLDEAREHALWILEAAEAAESDAFVFQWLTRDIIGDKADATANFDKIMEEFQAFREARKK